MLNAETVKEIAKTNETASTVLGACAKRERFREEINLKKFKYDLIKSGVKVVDDEFVATFKSLEQAGIGSLIRGRGGNPDRFRWNFNIREVGAAAFSEGNVELKEIKHRPKKHLTSTKPTDKQSSVSTKPSVQIVINLSGSVKSKDLEALISLAKELE